ncbi:MAG: ABC transporter permease [Saccharofermentanales bacterium]|jgi:ribose transport system permease protein
MSGDLFEKQRKRLVFVRKYGTALFGLFVFILFSILASPNFLTFRNMMILLRSMSMLTIVALGFTFVMAAGGFDMSLGNAAGLINLCFVFMYITTNSLFLSIVVSILLGILVGSFNGLLAGVMGLPDFIATFAIGSITYGLKMLWTKGNPVNIPQEGGEAVFFLGQGKIGPIPFPVIIMLIFVLAVMFILQKTRLGRRIYAIGGNRLASEYSGINVKKYRFLTFMFSGGFLAVAAILLTSRLGSGQPLAGEDFMLDTIAAVYLSTTMFGEGEPTPLGTFIGALIIAMLTNGLTMMGVEYYFQYITKGIVVILSVLLSVVLKKKMNQ